MLIGIDGNEANEVRGDVSGRVGVNNYSFNLLWGLYNLAQKNKKITFKIFLKSTPKKDLPPQSLTWKYGVLEGKRLWILTRLMPRLAFSSEIDVFFAPNHYLPINLFTPMVCMIHDLGYLEFSGQFQKNQYWQLKYWSAISMIISKCIICPSEATKKDIVRHYPFASKKVYVVPHGYDSKNFNINISKNVVRRVKNKYKIKNNYLLFIGTLKPSKNVEGLIDAFQKVSGKYPDYQLVIAGAKGWMYEKIFEKVKLSGLSEKVLFTGYLDEEGKPALLKGARAFILPSFWEGFGIDVLNALGSGTPVVLSRVASLPEIAGDVGIYINPSSIDDLTDGIKKVLEMTKVEYNSLVSNGIAQARKFSWERCARETLKVISSINDTI